MSTPTARLSTCYHCGGTIRHMAGNLPHLPRQWVHVTTPSVQHTAEPDDGAVSGPADDEKGDELVAMEIDDELEEIDMANLARCDADDMAEDREREEL